MRVARIETRERRHRVWWMALGAAFGATLFGEPAWPGDEVAIERGVELSGAEIAARAEVAAVDLAESLRSVGSSLRSSGPISAGPQGLSEEENRQLVEAAVKDELDGLTRDLDDLSDALGVDKDGGEAAALLRNLARRKANLIALLQTTQRPVIPADELRALAERWKDLDELSAALGRGEGSDVAPRP